MADVNVLFKFKRADDSGIKAVDAAADAIRTAESGISRIAESGGLGVLAIGKDRIVKAAADVRFLGQELLNASAKLDQTRESMAALPAGSAEWSQVATQMALLESRAAGLRDELKRMPLDLREGARANIGYLGDLDTGFQTLGSTISNLGASVSGTQGGTLSFLAGPLSGVGGGLGIAGDIAAAGEALPNLSNALGIAKEEFIASSSKIIDFTKANAGLITGVGAASVAVGALVLAFGAINQRVQDDIDAFRESILATGDAFRESATASRDEREQRLASIQEQLRIEEQLFTSRTDRAVELAREVYRLNGGTDEATASITDMNDAWRTMQLYSASALGQFSEQANEFYALVDAVDESGTRLSDLNTELVTFFNAVDNAAISISDRADDIVDANQRQLQGVLDAQGMSSDSLEQRREELLLEQQTLQQTVEQLTALNEEGPGAAMQLRDANNRLQELQTELSTLNNVIAPLVQAREEEEAAIQAEADALEQRNRLSEVWATYNESVLSEQQDGLSRQKDIHEKFAADLQALDGQASESSSKLLSNFTKKAEQIVTAGRAKEASINQNYMERSVKLVAAYRDEELRVNKEFNKERIRALEDLQDSLLEAEQSNDVIRFMNIQRQGEKELRRMDQDASDAEQERSKNFRDQQAALRKDRAANLKSLQDSIADQRKALADSYQEEQIALEDNVAEKRRVLQQGYEQDLITERRALGDRLAALKAGLDESVRAEYLAGKQRVQTVQQASAQMTNSIVSSFSRAMAGLNGRVAQYTPYQTPTIQQVAIPKTSAGYTPGGGSYGTSNSVTIQANVGAGLSANEVNQRLRTLGHEVLTMISKGSTVASGGYSRLRAGSTGAVSRVR